MRPTLHDISARLGHSRALVETTGWRAGLDSRQIRPGDLFIAIAGERQNGHAFIPMALDRGAAAVVGQRDMLSASLLLDQRILAVANSRAALLELGALAREGHSGPVVAITGSNGKTTTKELVLGLLAGNFRVAGSRGNQNSTMGAPLSLLNELDGEEIYVMEAGMSQPGEIAALCRMAHPTHGCITNIQPAHLAGTGGLDEIAREKGSLFQWLADAGGWGIVNEDDPLVVRQAEVLRRRSGFSLRDHRPGADSGMEAAGVDEQARCRIRLSGRELTLPVPGQAFLECVAAAVAICTCLGLDTTHIIRGLKAYSGEPGRMELKRIKDWVLLDDSYNANPASMRAALKTLAQFHNSGRRIAVLGEMLELGEESLRLHREIGAEAGRLELDLILLVGSTEARAALAEGLRDTGGMPAGEAESAAAAVALFRPAAGDVVLLKGSRSIGLEILAGEWSR